MSSHKSCGNGSAHAAYRTKARYRPYYILGVASKSRPVGSFHRRQRLRENAQQAKTVSYSLKNGQLTIVVDLMSSDGVLLPEAIKIRVNVRPDADNDLTAILSVETPGDSDENFTVFVQNGPENSPDIIYPVGLDTTDSKKSSSVAHQPDNFN